MNVEDSYKVCTIHECLALMSMFGIIHVINISLMLICGVNNESTWDRTKTILLKRETLNQSSSVSLHINKYFFFLKPARTIKYH